MFSFHCLFRHGVFYLPKAHKKIQEHGSLLWWESLSLIKCSQCYHLVLCRLPATASRKVLGRCVLKLCWSEYMFEDNAVFRVDVWDRTVLTVASFLQLLISFLPVSRGSLLISYLACLPVSGFPAISNRTNNGIFFTLLTWFCLCPFLSISLSRSCLAVSLRKRYSSSNCFEEVIMGNLWEPAIQFSGTRMWRIFHVSLPCMRCTKFSSDVFGHYIESLHLVENNLPHSNCFVLAELM